MMAKKGVVANSYKKKVFRKESVLPHGLGDRELKGKRGLMVCRVCQNVYYDKKWFSKDRFYKEHPDKLKASKRFTVCPACERKRLMYPEGIVNLNGDFFRNHRQEVFNLIKAVEKRQQKNNPLDRLISIEDTKDRGSTITTTKRELAVAIGKELKRAFKGDLKIKWTKGEDLVRIEWER